MGGAPIRNRQLAPIEPGLVVEIPHRAQVVPLDTGVVYGDHDVGAAGRRLPRLVDRGAGHPFQFLRPVGVSLHFGAAVFEKLLVRRRIQLAGVLGAVLPNITSKVARGELFGVVRVRDEHVVLVVVRVGGAGGGKGEVRVGGGDGDPTDYQSKDDAGIAPGQARREPRTRQNGRGWP